MPDEDDFDIVSAIERAMETEPAEEVETNESPAPVAQDIQPQAAPEAEQPKDGVTDSEEAKASAADTPAPVVAEAPKTNPEPPKAEQRVVEKPSQAPEADAATNQSLERINAIVQQLEVAAQGKFADLKTEADVLALMQTDPTRYNEFVIAQTQYQRAKQAQTLAQQEAQRGFIAGEQKRLTQAIPELSDPEKGDALKAKLRAYAKSQGIPDSRQARNADEVIRLHREMTLAEENATLKAEKKAQAEALAKASEKAASAPPVQKPGVQRDTNKGEEAAKSDFERFSNSGRTDDLAAYLNRYM